MLKIKDDIPLDKLKDFCFFIYQSIDDGQFYYCIIEKQNKEIIEYIKNGDVEE